MTKLKVLVLVLVFFFSYFTDNLHCVFWGVVFEHVLQAVELENLFIAGDANQDGVLTLNEFREIVSSADASVSETNALRMFRETVTLMPDGGDSISPTAFAIVAHAHGLKAPATVVFGLLKKTWLQV